MMKVIATILLAVTLVGCSGARHKANYAEMLDSWLYANADELMIDWGAPTKTTTLSDGRRLLEYNWSERSHQGGGIYVSRWCQTKFIVDKYNKIQEVKSDGNGCRVSS